jgi:hypothetical protein
MGYTVNISYERRPEKNGLTRDEAILLAEREAKLQSLPSACPECGEDWAHGTTEAVGQSQEWSVRFRCPRGHE